MSFNYININSPKLFPKWNGGPYSIYNDYLCNINITLPLPEGINELWTSYDEIVCSSSSIFFNLYFDNVAARYYYGKKMVQIDGKDYNKVNFQDSKTRCWIHIKSGTEDGSIEIYNNGVLITSYTGNINDGENFKKMIFNCGGTYGNSSATGFKNLIVSDTEIGKTETIVSMPVTVETDMETTSTDGKYLITEHGQKYMMTPDTMKLAETFDLKNVMIRRASIISKSASSAFGNDISVLKATKNNETLAEVEMIENNESQGVEYAFAVNKTASDFSNDKYGWVAK